MWGDTVRIGGGEALSSFRATTRNPEIPGHGITQDARAMRHYSTLCHPEAGPRIECGVTQCASETGRHSRHSAPRRGIQKYRQDITQDARAVRLYSTLCHLQSWAPLRMWGDTVRIGGGEALSSFRATTRNPEIPGHGITQYSRTVRHYSTLCHPEAGPRVECGVTQCASRVG